MDSDKVIQDLNRRFAAPLPEFYKRRIIIWHDEDRAQRSRSERKRNISSAIVEAENEKCVCVCLTK